MNRSSRLFSLHSPLRYSRIILAQALLLAGCVADTATTRPPPVAAPPMAQRPTPSAPVAAVDHGRPPRALADAIRQLGSGFDGRVGIAVRRIDSDWVIEWNGAALMPQQSVSKLWVAMTLLDQVDRGKLQLDRQVTIRREDLTLFHQPIADLVGRDGYTTTLSDLFARAMTQSDNTANDALLHEVGGPEAVRGFLARRFIAHIGFGPGERGLQSAAAGLAWTQSLSQGRAFYTARANLPVEVRTRALERYLASPPDGAAAGAVTLALAKLVRGEMLSANSTAYLLATMHEAKTGAQRIKSGVPAGWRYAHKTGTGQELGSLATGFNDVGVMTAPDGTSYAVAVMIGSTRLPIQQRWSLMQQVARAVAASHEK